jgi:hypothetical protein
MFGSRILEVMQEVFCCGIEETSEPVTYLSKVESPLRQSLMSTAYPFMLPLQQRRKTYDLNRDVVPVPVYPV